MRFKAFAMTGPWVFKKTCIAKQSVKSVVPSTALAVPTLERMHCLCQNAPPPPIKPQTIRLRVRNTIVKMTSSISNTLLLSTDNKVESS